MVIAASDLDTLIDKLTEKNTINQKILGHILADGQLSILLNKFISLSSPVKQEYKRRLLVQLAGILGEKFYQKSGLRQQIIDAFKIPEMKPYLGTLLSHVKSHQKLSLLKILMDKDEAKKLLQQFLTQYRLKIYDHAESLVTKNTSSEEFSIHFATELIDVSTLNNVLNSFRLPEISKDENKYIVTYVGAEKEEEGIKATYKIAKKGSSIFDD